VHYKRLTEAKDTKPLLHAMFATFKVEFVFLVLTEVVMCINGCLNPILMKYLVDFIREGTLGNEGLDYEHLTRGTFLVALFIANELFERFCNQNKDVFKNRNGNKAKNVLKNCIYRKFSTISNASNKEFAEGELLGLMSEDAQKADDIFHMIAGLCHMPFNTFGTFFFLLYYFG
jgi:hypothetical protein